MRFALDTEFLEYHDGEGTRIIPISVGLVAEDGRELYVENSTFNWELAERHNPWLLEHVRPHLLGEPAGSPTWMGYRVAEFLRQQGVGKPEVWAYFADYDWVVLCGLWGRMVDLPRWMNKYCLDLKQEMHQRGVTRADLPPQDGAAHNALADASWVMGALRYLGVVDWQRGTAVRRTR